MIPVASEILSIAAVSLATICGTIIVNADKNFTTAYATKRWSCRHVEVEITVSATVTAEQIRLLELSWNTEDFFPGDYVGIYTADPTENKDLIPVFREEVTTRAGWVTSDIQETRDSWNLTFYPECKGYWAAYRNNISDEVIAWSCLKTEPRWMKENEMFIENLTLVNTFVPGTHNTGSYLESETSYVETRVSKYTYTQDENTLAQLIYGARYLDLRIGYYATDTENWWVNHSFLRIIPLSTVLRDIKKFIENTEEIVIVDFHHFPVGFKNGSIHNQLVDYIEEQLKDFIAPSSLGWDSTLRTIWAGGQKRIIISYNHQPLYYYNNIIWPEVKHKWANAQNLNDLLLYLESIFFTRPNYPWAAMAELTPTFGDILFDRLGGLRNMADTINKNVTYLLRNRWGMKCNIVAVDFIRSTGIVKAAIAWNKRRALNQLCDPR